jgi:hypothetical protein
MNHLWELVNHLRKLVNELWDLVHYLREVVERSGRTWFSEGSGS